MYTMFIMEERNMSGRTMIQEQPYITPEKERALKGWSLLHALRPLRPLGRGFREHSKLNTAMPAPGST